VSDSITNQAPDDSALALRLDDPPIIERDDGMFALGWNDGTAGPFESRTFAEAVAARRAA
jgi:hypothetical protein